MTLIERAFELAIDLHKTQSRKASIIPNAAYMSHLAEVAGMVWGCFAVDDPMAETVVAAALLHDAIEDQPEENPRKQIFYDCSEAVLDLVEELTEKGSDRTEKAPWQERKQSYLDHISKMSTSALLISVCDKLQSARELKRQVRRLGNLAYEPFLDSGEEQWQCRDRQIWFQVELVKAYQRRLWAISKDFKGPIIDAIQALIDEFDEVVERLPKGVIVAGS